MNYPKLQQIFSLATCFLMILAVAIHRDQKALGTSLILPITPTSSDSIFIQPDGTTIVNTTTIGKDIQGYAGAVPLKISLRNDTIIAIETLANQETPSFFREASVLLDTWKGKTAIEAQQLKVDAISGATYSSNAIIGNVRVGLQTLQQTQRPASFSQQLDLSPKFFGALLVVLMAVIVPLISKNRHLRTLQLVLNVVVLGCWTGTFISYTNFIAFAANGVNLITMIVPALMLILAFVYPLFGKKNYYCTHVCPFGSLQELAGRCTKRKPRIPAILLRHLNTFRQVLWVVLMLCLWSGVWFDWVAYEPFSAFIYQSADIVVIGIALTFMVISAFVPRAYCRFVCPTGTLFKISQG